MAKTLVPMLLRKADKIHRGHTERTGGHAPPACSTGLDELGFMLGGCLRNTEVQRSFGLSKHCAKNHVVPLVSDFLPQFFAATGQQLIQSISVALDLLQRNGRRLRYMMCRDEVVFARAFAIVYGMCLLEGFEHV